MQAGESYAYDSPPGQSTQQDPIGIAGGANVYGFASGDPVNLSDPFGLCGKDVQKADKYKQCVEVSLEEGKAIGRAALQRMQAHQDAGVEYAAVRPLGANQDDCNNFCEKSIKAAGLEVPATATWQFATSMYYARVHPRRRREGDVMWQPGHVGIFSGTYDAKGRPLGYQMGTHGAALLAWGPGGEFSGGEQLIYYRLLKRIGTP